MRCGATRILAVFAVLLLAPPARTDDDEDEFAYHDLTTLSSTLESGFFFNSADEFGFGDYTGLTDSGWSVLGNTNIGGRSAFDADSAHYYRLRGLNLGLDSRYIDAEYKTPGLFGLSFLFDEMPKYRTDSAKSFFLNSGSEYLALPPGWDDGNNPTPAQMSTLEADLHNLAIDHKRRTLGGGASLIFSEHIDFDASYTHQTKKGEKLVGGVIGLNGGNPRAVVLPEPLDYETHQIDSHIRYTADDVQLQLQYYASGFNNDNHSLTWENPYTAQGSWAPEAGFPTGVGQKGQMPDNWFHQIIGSGGLSLPANSRLMVNTAFGWGKQTDDFLPYTGNPLLATPLGLPRNDLDGMLKTRLVTARFTSNPLPRFGFDAGYRWSQRDNDSPVDTYFQVRSDAEDQDPDNARINRPYSFQQHNANTDVSYEILKRTKLTLMYEWERIYRNLQEVKQTDEHSFAAKLLSRPNRYVNLGARYERSYLDGDEYDCVKPLVVTEPPGVLTDPGCAPDEEWENHPALRKYYLANVQRNVAHAWLNLMPVESLTLGFNARYRDEDFYDSTYGLTDYRSLGPGVDLSYTPLETLNFHAFYSYEKIKTDMASIEFGGDPENEGFDPDNRWWSQEKNIFHTAGAGVHYDVLPDRLRIGMEYLFAKSRGIVDRWEAPGFVPVSSFPDETTRLHDISVYGALQITRNVSMRVGYLFEKFDSNSWATERVCPACLTFSGSAAVIGSGENSPDYDAHLVSWSVIYRFW